jgi:iron complex transport system substrate-binding protein
MYNYRNKKRFSAVIFCAWFTALCCVAAAGLVLPQAVSAGGDREAEGSAPGQGAGTGAGEPAGERRGGEDGNPGPDLFPHKAEIRYADGFAVEYHGNFKRVRILEPWQGSDETFEYILVQRGTEPPSGYPEAQVIEIPVESIVTMSTTYVTYLDMLGELDSLVGIDSFLFVMNPEVRKMIGEGTVEEVGSGPEVNVEILLELSPDIIMAHSIGGEWDAHPKLLEAGLAVAMNAEHMEQTPLGRFEWIKYVSLFFNKEKAANGLFDVTEERYQELAGRVAGVGNKPAVLVNAPYQGVWWIPGGESFQAEFIDDAGGDYIWSENDATGALMLNIESVYERAADADIWINPGMWESLEEALAEDERFALFEAFQNGKVYNNNRRANKHGGSSYWETGVANPHVVLADLIKIFHPELLPEHEFVYYYRLE